jgi:Tfp pilus assembly protein PilO
MIWREKQALLIVLGVLLLGNVLFFFTYRVQYRSRLDDAEARVGQAEQQLAQARRTRVEAEQQVSSYKKVQNDLQSLYNQRLSTETERLTILINEIKRLAVASQLTPKSYSFAKTEHAEAGMTGSSSSTRSRGSIGTTAVTIAFSVEGTYQQLRRLINLLELSDQFVIVDSISLGGGGENETQTLQMNLRLKTLFRDPVVSPTARSASSEM